MEYIVKKEKIISDGTTSAMFIGITKEGLCIKIENCHLVQPPFKYNLNIPCLFGNYVTIHPNNVYHYRIAYLSPKKNGYWRIII